MIYAIFTYFLISSFITGYAVCDDRDEPTIVFIAIFLLGPLATIWVIIEEGYKRVIRFIDERTPIVFILCYYFTKRYDNLSPEHIAKIKKLATEDFTSNSFSDRSFRWCASLIEKKYK